MFGRENREFWYGVGGLIRVRLCIATCSSVRGRMVGSKFAALVCDPVSNADIVMHVGRFEPRIPADATIVDKDFHCAENYLFFRGDRHRGATEIVGLESGPIVVRHRPYRETWWQRPLSGLRGINMYLEPLIKYVLLRDHGAHLLHAAALTREGRGVMLLGANGTHKTRVALDCCHRHGFQILGDDLALVVDGQIRSVIEHPHVLAFRWQAMVRHRRLHASSWPLWLRVAAGKAPSPLPPIGQSAHLGGLILLSRQDYLNRPQTVPANVEMLWMHAQALERHEFCKYQRRNRQVVNLSRFAMAYEYALPGSRFFAGTVGQRVARPVWFDVPGIHCRLPNSYDPRTTENVVQFWKTVSGYQQRVA